MKNMLVTGGCGFIGSNFIRYILNESDFDGRIVNVNKLTYAGNPESLLDIEKEFHDRYIFIKADICDLQEMTRIFEEFFIDTVCHFAAESHVDRSIVGPDSFIQSNIIGTFNLLECCRAVQHQIILFHHISTDEVFGSLGEEGYFTETTPYNPSSPYSASKASSDHFVKAYFPTYKLPILITNCSNNFGPYQFPEKLIPLMILNIVEEKPLPVYGDGKNVRDWLFVLDHCEALLNVFEEGIPGETYNIGGGAERQNIDVVYLLCDLLDDRLNRKAKDSSRNLISFVTDRPGHDRRYALNCDKIQQRLGWKPRIDFRTGAELTIRWYSENRTWWEKLKGGEFKEYYEKAYRL